MKQECNQIHKLLVGIIHINYKHTLVTYFKGEKWRVQWYTTLFLLKMDLQQMVTSKMEKQAMLNIQIRIMPISMQ